MESKPPNQTFGGFDGVIHAGVASSQGFDLGLSRFEAEILECDSSGLESPLLVYAYEEDGEETGKTVRVDFLFTLKFDEAGKLKIVKTQQLSETESQKYGRDSQN